jgi:excisionase family DNA binding protein
METTIPQMMSIDVLAARLGVSPWTVRTWLRQGRTPFFKIGKRILIRESDAATLLEQNYKPAARPAEPTSNGHGDSTPAARVATSKPRRRAAAR